MKRLIPILLAVFAFAACEKDPDLNKLADAYLVYTSEASDANFSTPTTYYVADAILVASSSETSETLTGTGAQEILNAISTQMKARGYTLSDTKEDADLAISVTYVQSTYYFTDYGYPNWIYGSGSYWGNYWGWGGGFYYPYSMTYSLTTNSFIIDMGYQGGTAATSSTSKLPIWWTCYMVAPAYSSSYSASLAVKGVQQAFSQSTYIKK